MPLSESELIDKLGEAQKQAAEALNAVDRIKTALDLPFRPSAFKPLADLFYDTGDMLSCVFRIIRERDEAIAKLNELQST